MKEETALRKEKEAVHVHVDRKTWSMDLGQEMYFVLLITFLRCTSGLNARQRAHV